MNAHDVDQLALFLNGRDTQESGTAIWEKLPRDARESYRKDATAILGALELLGWAPAVPPTDDEREALARECYRRLYPGHVNTHDSARTRESDAREFDRAYETWDQGREGYAPGLICRGLADAILAAGFRRQGPITDAQVEAAWRAGAAVFGDYDENPGGRDLRAMRAALEAARAVS